jgi:predicted MPP superfamily phosphohydrolase
MQLIIISVKRRLVMKKKIPSILLLILLTSVVSLSPSSESYSKKMTQTTPGDLLTVSCSNLYPCLGEPISLIITIEGKSQNRFNQTISITDNFTGLEAVDGEIIKCSGTVAVDQINISIGPLPRYTRKVTWYPSIVGNHTFHVKAGAVSEMLLNISVVFDVEGIITPSLGYPAIIVKEETSPLAITVSEERTQTQAPLEITHLKLESIDAASSYPLENQTGAWRTWVRSSRDSIKEELTVYYSTDSVPEGFYNLSLTTQKTTYKWPHAVQIINSTPTNYTIVQFSDTHIGKYAYPVNKKKELIRLITYMNEQIHPNLVILSGDSVDWYNQRTQRNVYLDLQEALLHCNAPVFTTPGNHERYGNSLLHLYYPFKNLTAYHRFLNPLNDYSIIQGNNNLVFLDSGYDYSRWEIQPKIWLQSPEGSGLTATQIYLLENLLGDAQKNQLIIMHHPAVNDVNDTGFGALPNTLPSGNNECIAMNRGAFISYCENFNVSLVLTGHTHENHVFTSLGKEVENTTAWPLFIPTDSSTMSGKNNGGRLIQINNSTVISYDYLAFSSSDFF